MESKGRVCSIVRVFPPTFLYYIYIHTHFYFVITMTAVSSIMQLLDYSFLLGGGGETVDLHFCHSALSATLHLSLDDRYIFCVVDLKPTFSFL